MDTAGLKELLQETAVFTVLTAAERDELAATFEPVEYKLGQTVVRAGDESDAFYLVAAGRARVIAEDGGEEVTVGALGRGDHLGEQGLLTGGPREYTVRAAGDLTLYRLRKRDFDRLLQGRPELELYFTQYISDFAVRNFLKLCTVFSPLPAREIRELLRCLTAHEYAPGQTIVREGDAGDAFYILRSGGCVVTKESEGGKVLKRLQRGDCFGELALLTGQPRAATVKSEETCSLFRLQKGDFERIVATAPRVKQAFAAMGSGYGESTDGEPAPELVALGKPRVTELRAQRYPVLLQDSEGDCGAACLAMVLRYYRKPADLNRLCALTAAVGEGGTLATLAEAAEAVGFRARGLQASARVLAALELPAIAQWEGSGYVVVYEIRADHVIFADPRTGLRHLTFAEFARSCSGYVLLLTASPRLDKVEESHKTVWNYLPLLKSYKKQLAEIFVASVMLQIFTLCTPIFTQVIVDRVLVQKSVAMLNAVLTGMILVAVFQSVTAGLRKYLMIQKSSRIDLIMGIDLYRHVLSLPIRFFEERKVGELLKRFNENIKIRDLLTGRGLLSTLDCTMIVVYLCLMMYYSVKLTLLALLFVGGYILLTAAVTPILKGQARETFQRAAEADASLVESITGASTVKATASEGAVRRSWEGLIVRALNSRFRSSLTGVTTGAMNNALQAMSSAIVLWYGARLVIAGDLTIGQLMAFVTLTANVMAPVITLSDLWGDMQEISIGVERVNDVFETKPEEDPAQPGLMRLPAVKGHLRFENVTFRYPTRSDRNAIENVNLEIYPGQTVALIGRSGAGKSTFASLLLRLHVPDRGRIFIDGYDIGQVSLGSLRAQVGVVPQEVVLFSGTIRQNIAFGQPDAPMEQVVGAATMAGAHDFVIGLPMGYETVVGERGQSLSGGQRQRIAIARALFKKPRILIFDEATSALDTESERTIQHNMETILKGRTTLVIAHRLSTVRHADLIIVMDAGKIVESGTHSSLMEQRGLYYYLNSEQLEG